MYNRGKRGPYLFTYCWTFKSLITALKNRSINAKFQQATSYVIGSSCFLVGNQDCFLPLYVDSFWLGSFLSRHPLPPQLSHMHALSLLHCSQDTVTTRTGECKVCSCPLRLTFTFVQLIANAYQQELTNWAVSQPAAPAFSALPNCLCTYFPFSRCKMSLSILLYLLCVFWMKSSIEDLLMFI